MYIPTKIFLNSHTNISSFQSLRLLFLRTTTRTHITPPLYRTSYPNSIHLKPNTHIFLPLNPALRTPQQNINIKRIHKYSTYTNTSAPISKYICLLSSQPSFHQTNNHLDGWSSTDQCDTVLRMSASL